MDLTKFLSACTFMYLQQKVGKRLSSKMRQVHEPHIEVGGSKD